MSESEQNLAGQRIHEEKLRRYLLGQCSADESAEIERAAFQDSSVSDALSVIEDELTEDYVGDQLNDFDRSCFELKFLTSSERREKLRLSALLLNRAEVLRRVPPSFVRAHQLMAQEMKEALGGTEEGSYVSALVTGGGQELLRDALHDKIPGSIPIASDFLRWLRVPSANSVRQILEGTRIRHASARRWKRWIALGAATGLLFLILYGIRVRLSTPVNTTSPVLNPTSPVLNPSPAVLNSTPTVLIPTPYIVFVTLEGNDSGLRAHPPESPESAVIIVKGGNFTEGATVQWNGSNRETKFLNSTTLLARCPKTDLAIASIAKTRIVVVNPPPGGGPSPPVILSPTPEK